MVSGSVSISKNVTRLYDTGHFVILPADLLKIYIKDTNVLIQHLSSHCAKPDCASQLANILTKIAK